MKPCGTCKEVSISNEVYNVNPEKLDSVVMKYLPKQIKIYHNDANQKFNISGLIPNQYIFYFATNSRTPNLKILKKDQAYGDLTNSGIALTNQQGNAIVYLNCPQIYIFDDGKIYHRHLHFVYWNKNLKKWESDLYTHPVLCIVDFTFINQWSNYIKLVNALPKDNYNKFHIPNSYNLPYNEVWNEKNVLKTLNIRKKETPIVVYCWDQKCNAGEKVCKRLNLLKFYNVYLYSKGLKDFTSKNNFHLK